MGVDLYRKDRLVASFDAQGILTFIDEKNVPQIVKRTRSLEAFKLQRESDVTRTNMRYLQSIDKLKIYVTIGVKNQKDDCSYEIQCEAQLATRTQKARYVR